MVIRHLQNTWRARKNWWYHDCVFVEGNKSQKESKSTDTWFNYTVSMGLYTLDECIQYETIVIPEETDLV